MNHADCLMRLAHLASRPCAAGPGAPARHADVFAYRRTAPGDVEASVYEPVLCLVLQGAKHVSTGDHAADLGPGDALVVSHDLPVVSRVTRASDGAPYLALIVRLDLGLVGDLHADLSGPPDPAPARSLVGAAADAPLLSALIRYLELQHDPEAMRILGPGTWRELHYRVLRSPAGRALRCRFVADSRAARVARAIARLRTEFRTPLAVSDLARTAGMSESSFHAHFKAITGTTPRRFQKDLRLIEAQGLLAGPGRSVSEVAYAVGYESPAQFSRDFRAKFGRPPSDRRGNVAPRPAP